MHRRVVLSITALVACSSPPHLLPDGGRDAGVAPDASDAPADTPVDAAADGAPLFAYVANYLAGISAFTIDASGGLVALGSAPFASTVHFYGIAAHPSRPILYGADYGGHAVRAYQIQPSGELQPIGDPVALDHPAISIAVDPLGRFVYVGDFDDVAFTGYALHTFAIDATGALAPASSLSRTAAVTAIAADPAGRVVYTTGDPGIRAYAIAADGSLAELATSPFGASPLSGGWIAFHPTAHVLYTARQSLAGFAIAPADGALAALDGSPFTAGTSGDPGAIAFAVDPRGRFACAVDMAAGTLTVYTLASDGRVVVPGTSYDVGTSAYAVAIDPTGRFVYVTTDFGNVAAFAVDPGNLALMPLSSSPLLAVVGNQPEMVIVRAPAP